MEITANLISRVHQLSFYMGKEKVYEAINETTPLSKSMFHWAWMLMDYKPRDIELASNGQNSYSASCIQAWTYGECDMECCDDVAVTLSKMEPGVRLCEVCEEIENDQLFAEENF